MPHTKPLSPAEHAARERSARRFALRLVLGILGTVGVVYVIALTVIADARIEVVRPDAYEAGEAHDDEVARQQEGARLGLSIQLVSDGAAGLAVAVVPEPSLLNTPAEANALLPARLVKYRPSDASRDQRLELSWNEDRRMLVSGPANLGPGPWLIRAELGEGPRAVIERTIVIPGRAP